MNRARPASYTYLIQETLLFFSLSFLVFFGGSKFSLINPAYLLVYSIFLTLLFLFFLWKRPIVPTLVSLPLLIMLLVIFLTSLTSIDPRRSLSEFALVSFAVCLFFLTSELVRRGWPAELFIKVLLLVSAIFMALCWAEFFQWVIPWILIHPGVWLPAVPFRLSNPNLVAVLVNVWLMIALGRLLSSRSLSARIFLSLWVLSALGVLYLTSSRGGWLGTAAGLICMAFLFLRTKSSVWLPLWQAFKSKRWLQWAAAAVLLLAILAASLLLLRQLNAPGHGSRNEFWTPALQAFTASPLLGKGPFTFISAYLQANSVPPMLYFDYAHSIYMDLLSGTGILGLLAFLWLVYSVIRVFWRDLNQPDPEHWAITTGALSALAAFLFHGFVDSVHHTEPISLWSFCIIMAVALAAYPRPQKTTRLESICKVVLVAIVTCFSWANVWAFLPYQAGVEAANAGNLPLAAQQLSLAQDRDPALAITHQQLGYILSQQAASGESGKLPQAIQAFEKTVQMDPYWALNQANLGALYASNKQNTAALAAFSKAAKLSPDFPLYQLNLGVSAEQNGDLSTAESAFQIVLNLAPDWRQAYFWRANAFRQQVWQNWLAGQPPAPAAKTISELEQEIEAQPDAPGPALELANTYYNQSDYPASAKVLAAAQANGAGSNIDIDWLKAELLARNGDISGAAASGEQILKSRQGYYLFGPGTSGNIPYAIYMFRRPAIPVDVVPQLEVITMTDQWGKRALQMASWFELSGKKDKAQFWRDKVKKEIPDFTDTP